MDSCIPSCASLSCSSVLVRGLDLKDLRVMLELREDLKSKNIIYAIHEELRKTFELTYKFNWFFLIKNILKQKNM